MLGLLWMAATCCDSLQTFKLLAREQTCRCDCLTLMYGRVKSSNLGLLTKSVPCTSLGGRMTSIPQGAASACSQRACRLCRSLHLSSTFSVDPAFRHFRQDARERRRQKLCSRHGHIKTWACADAAASQWDCSQQQPTIPQPQQQQKPHRRWRQLLWWAALLSVLWATAGPSQSSSKFASITATATGASRECESVTCCGASRYARRGVHVSMHHRGLCFHKSMQRWWHVGASIACCWLPQKEHCLENWHSRTSA